MPGFATYHLGFDSISVADSAMAPVAEPNPLDAVYPEGLDLEERPE